MTKSYSTSRCREEDEEGNRCLMGLDTRRHFHDRDGTSIHIYREDEVDTVDLDFGYIVALNTIIKRTQEARV